MIHREANDRKFPSLHLGIFVDFGNRTEHREKRSFLSVKIQMSLVSIWSWDLCKSSVHRLSLQDNCQRPMIRVQTAIFLLLSSVC